MSRARFVTPEECAMFAGAAEMIGAMHASTQSPPLSKNTVARLVALFTFMGASSADPVHAQEQPPPVAEYTIAPEGLIVKTPAGTRTLTLPRCTPKAII